MGRIGGRDTTNEVALLEVLLPDSRGCFLTEDQVFVRASNADADPVAVLQAQAHETAFFVANRQPFVRELLLQRATARGLTGLLSANVELLPHQIEAVRRVLTDPVPRYLLADEVGLGKTIEAGAAVRQTLLDDPTATVLVLAPEPLCRQWRRELDAKFQARSFGDRLSIRSLDALSVRLPEATLVVVDEAHRIAACAHSDDEMDRHRYAALVHLAHAAPRVLLLSATPAAHDERAFLAMLHLLDPSAYRLEDLDAFRLRLERRDEIARALLTLSPSAPAVLLRNAARRLLEAVPDDELLADLVETLIQAAPEARAEALQALHLHVTETYRLFRRMVRHRRRTVQTPFPRLPDESTLRVPIYTDDVREDTVQDALELWRAGLAAHVEAGDLDAAPYVDIFTSMASFSGDLDAVASLAQQRREAPPGTLPLVPGEDAHLAALVAAATTPGADVDRAATLVKSLARLLDSHETALVFAGTSARADVFTRALNAHVTGSAAGFHAGLSPGERAQAIESLGTPGGPRILVADRLGEEGLNLQQAALLVFTSLPWDPTRLEQAIGRLDRLGRTAPMTVRVLLGPGETPSFEHAWFEVCCDGLGLFETSIADLQLFLAEETPRWLEQVFREGIPALEALCEALPARIQQEREDLARQDVLDSVTVVDEDSAAFIEDLQRHDGEPETIQKALHPWLTGGLQLRADRQGPAWHYEPTTYSLLPLDLFKYRLRGLADRPGTYDRNAAVQRPALRLFRLGDPLFDALSQYVQWDDRGRAYALWRHVPSWSADVGSEWFGFVFDVIVEADLDGAQAILGDGEDLHALARLADGYLPPLHQRIFLRADGEPVHDEPLRGHLSQLYRPKQDRNLHKNRRAVLDRFIEPTHWPAVCADRWRDAIGALREDSQVARRTRFAVNALEADLARLRTRTRLREVWGGDARQDGLRTDTLLEALLPGLQQPRLSLDAVGFVVISGTPLPGADADD